MVPVDQAGHQQDRALDELQPTMSESLNAITEKFLKIDVLDGKQDVSQFIAYLLDTVELLTRRVAFLQMPPKGVDQSKDSTSENQPPPSSGSHANIFVCKVLHRVVCDKYEHSHNGMYFEDTPTYNNQHSKELVKLTGNKVIYNLDTYLGLHPNICLLVINEHYCTSMARTMGHRQTQEQSTESLRIVAPLLQKALLEVAEYHPGPFDHGADRLKAQRMAAEYHQGPFGHGADRRQSQGMFAPYPFLFHHRKKLVQLALDETYRGVLSPLLEFLAINYSKEYEEAHALFAEGIVTGHHLSKLFKPNQMVISRQKSSILEAYVLYACSVPEKGKVALTGWSWVYDGNELSRQRWNQDIHVLPDERMRIEDVRVHPADFARAEDIANLEERGRKFWSMRDQAYICYTGWDKARQYQYVSGPPPFISFPFECLKLERGSDYITGWGKIHGRCCNLQIDAPVLQPYSTKYWC